MAATRVPRSIGRRWCTLPPGRSPLRRRASSPLEERLTSVLAVYGLVAALAAGLCVAFGRDPLVCRGWLGARGPAAVLLSLGSGVTLAAVTIAATRAIVRRAAWGRALYAALRPAVYRASDGALLALAISSATGEELFFRGLLVPTAGVVASSLLFGALHQMPGRARWGWMAWAAIMGLLFALVFAATGSLAGPIAAHAVINHANLRLLRDEDPDPPPRVLGGLLNR